MTFAPALAVVLGFHGVVERIEHPELQANHVDLAAFEDVVEQVRDRYDVVTLDDIAAALRGDASLPDRAAALTFDDGYRSVLELADPLLRSHGLPYAMFVPSGLVESGARMPTYVMQAALTFTGEPSVKLPGRRWAFKLRTVDERERAIAHGTELLRTLPRQDVDDLLELFRGLLSADRWEEINAMLASEDLLGWEELRVLAARGVDIGSHTRDHALLHEGQGVAEIDEQVRSSKAAIEERLGVPCRHLCYPHGHPRDVCRDAVEAAREAGYTASFMNVGGPVREGMDPLLLPRIAIVGSPPDAALTDRVQLSHSKWYRRVSTELGLD